MKTLKDYNFNEKVFTEIYPSSARKLYELNERELFRIFEVGSISTLKRRLNSLNVYYTVRNKNLIVDGNKIQSKYLKEYRKKFYIGSFFENRFYWGTFHLPNGRIEYYAKGNKVSQKEWNEYSFDEKGYMRENLIDENHKSGMGYFDLNVS